MNSACSSVLARWTWWQGYLAECISARFSKCRAMICRVRSRCIVRPFLWEGGYSWRSDMHSISRRMSQFAFQYDTIRIEQEQITCRKLDLLSLSGTSSVAGVVLEDIANLECGSVPHGWNFSSMWPTDLTKPINSCCILSCAQCAHAHPWKSVLNVHAYSNCWRRTISGQSRRSTTLQFTSLKLRHWRWP